MMSNHTHRPDAGLQGKKYEPPPLPSILRSNTRTEFADRRGAREIGRANAEDYSLCDEGGEYYYEQLIDEQANGALASTRDGYQQSCANVEKAGEDARQQRMDAEPRVIQIIERDRKDEETERKLAHLRGLGIVGYVFVVILGYIATLPQDIAAATGLPLPFAIQLVVAFTLGGVVMLAAHFAGEKALELEQARSKRAEAPGAYEKLKHEYIAAIALPVLFILAVAVWRGQTFAAEAKAVGGLFTSATAANVAFTLLGIVAFLAVFSAAKSYLRVKALRETRTKRAENKAAREQQQGIIDINERVEAQAKLSLEHLSGHEAKVVARIEAWREARKKALRHRAGVATQKHHKRLVHKGLRLPQPPAAASVRTTPDEPKPAGSMSSRWTSVGSSTISAGSTNGIRRQS